MSPEATSNCPSCKQPNAADMAFCIFCGSSMKGAAQVSSTGWQSTMGTGFQLNAGGESGTRLCTSCGQADALNSIFCIFCGAPIAGGVQPVNMPTRSVVSGAGGPFIGSAKASATNHGPLLLLVWVALGLALGGGSAFALKSSQPVQSALSLPARGLAILTGQPYADIFVTYPDKRHFLVGRTGAQGDLSVDDLLPGNYVVEAFDGKGAPETVEVEVSQNKAGIAGGPPGRQMLAADAGSH